MDNLRTILENHESLCPDQTKACGDCRRLQEALTVWHKQEVERIIGQDEDPNYSPTPGVGGFDAEVIARNGLRAEQRNLLTQKEG